MSACHTSRSRSVSSAETSRRASSPSRHTAMASAAAERVRGIVAVHRLAQRLGGGSLVDLPQRPDRGRPDPLIAMADERLELGDSLRPPDSAEQCHGMTGLVRFPPAQQRGDQGVAVGHAPTRLVVVPAHPDGITLAKAIDGGLGGVEADVIEPTVVTGPRATGSRSARSRNASRARRGMALRTRMANVRRSAAGTRGVVLDQLDCGVERRLPGLRAHALAQGAAELREGGPLIGDEMNPALAGVPPIGGLAPLGSRPSQPSRFAPLLPGAPLAPTSLGADGVDLETVPRRPRRRAPAQMRRAAGPARPERAECLGMGVRS